MSEILIYSGLTIFFSLFWLWLFHDRQANSYSDDLDDY